MGVLVETDSRKGYSVGNTTPYRVLFHFQLVILHICTELFHKFCRLSKNAEHKQDFNTYVLLDSHSSNLYPIFFQAKALMTSQVNT